jgi:hypothetical protein
MPAQIDRANRAHVHAALMRAVRCGANVIVADLTRTDFCGQAATVTLVSARARRSAGQLARSLSVARRARHAPPPGPLTDPA